MVASPTTAATNTRASGLLIYDGDCGFCTQTALKFNDLAGESASIASWQSLDLDDYDLTEEQCSTAAYFVDGDERYRGADAIGQGLQRCSGPYRLLGKVFSVPPGTWLARAAYPIIAKYRYRLPGATDACKI